MARLNERVHGIVEKVDSLDQRNARIEDKLDQLLQRWRQNSIAGGTVRVRRCTMDASSFLFSRSVGATTLNLVVLGIGEVGIAVISLISNDRDHAVKRADWITAESRSRHPTELFVLRGCPDPDLH